MRLIGCLQELLARRTDLTLRRMLALRRLIRAGLGVCHFPHALQRLGWVGVNQALCWVLCFPAGDVRQLSVQQKQVAVIVQQRWHPWVGQQGGAGFRNMLKAEELRFVFVLWLGLCYGWALSNG